MKAASGFEYHVQTIKDGAVVDTEIIHNLMPEAALNYMLSAALLQGTQYPTFYIGLFEGAYTPTPSDTMATFPSLATELTAYTETTRQALTLSTPAGGQSDNVGNEAEFTGTTDGKLVHGGFICTTPTKGAASGLLLSAVRFSSPKHLDAGSVLKVTCAATIESI